VVRKKINLPHRVRRGILLRYHEETSHGHSQP
jgi:hypothetical protein